MSAVLACVLAGSSLSLLRVRFGIARQAARNAVRIENGGLDEKGQTRHSAAPIRSSAQRAVPAAHSPGPPLNQSVSLPSVASFCVGCCQTALTAT